MLELPAEDIRYYHELQLSLREASANLKDKILKNKIDPETGSFLIELNNTVSRNIDKTLGLAG